MSSQKIKEPPKASDTKVNSEEIRQFAAAIADHISHMEPGESFKMLGGCFSHETRFVVVRNEDGTFTAYHYDTGGGSGGGCWHTAVKISEAEGKRLQELDFWQKFITLKVKEDGIGMMNKLISGLGKKETLSRELSKPTQSSNSCPFHAVEAEFKHTFVSHHQDLRVGLEQYKICTALMAEHAKNSESKTTDPALKDVFLAKEKIRHRYLNWFEIALNQEQYERVKNQYIDAIKKMSEDGQFESNIDEILRIEENSFVNTLEALNKKFEKCLKERTKKKFGRSEVELLERLNISQELWMQCSGRIKSKTLLEFTLPHLRKHLIANSGIIGKLDQLKSYVEENIPSASSQVVDYVKENFGIEYTIPAMIAILHRLGFVYKKPQLVPGKADPKAQEEFLEELEKLETELVEGDEIIYMDGVHPQHNSKPAYGWFKKGVATPLKANTGRQRININGALNANNLDVTIHPSASLLVIFKTDCIINIFNDLCHSIGIP